MAPVETRERTPGVRRYVRSTVTVSSGAIDAGRRRKAKPSPGDSPLEIRLNARKGRAHCRACRSVHAWTPARGLSAHSITQPAASSSLLVLLKPIFHQPLPPDPIPIIIKFRTLTTTGARCKQAAENDRIKSRERLIARRAYRTSLSRRRKAGLAAAFRASPSSAGSPLGLACSACTTTLLVLVQSSGRGRRSVYRKLA
jgi:hypothetical protein